MVYWLIMKWSRYEININLSVNQDLIIVKT